MFRWVGTPVRSAVLSQGLCRVQEGKLNNSRRMAAGFAAGVTEALMIVTPFEVVKIRLQQQQGSNKAALLYKVGAVACIALPRSTRGLEGSGLEDSAVERLRTRAR